MYGVLVHRIQVRNRLKVSKETKMNAPAKLLLIEESVLVTMANTPSFVKEFPFLTGLKNQSQAKSLCRPCSRMAASRINTSNGIKSSIISMGVEKKKRLKKMLNAEKVRIRVSQGGRVTEYTF